MPCCRWVFFSKWPWGKTYSVADLGGVKEPPLRPKIFSISCSFSQNLAKSYVGATPPPPVSWRPLLRGILDPTLQIHKLYRNTRLYWLMTKMGCSGGSRIFPREAPTPNVGVLTYYFANFLAENCMKMKEFWPWGDACPWSPPWIRQCVVIDFSNITKRGGNCVFQDF